MKTCTACGVSKQLSEYGWRYKDTPKAYQEARCKKCRAKENTLYNRRKRENAELKIYEETMCPCDACFKQTSCDAECLSYKVWVNYGV